VADVALLAAVWLDARRASPLGEGGISVTREAPPAFSVGRPGEVSYRWRNAARRGVRVRVREVRPALLGGTQPPRALAVGPRGEGRLFESLREWVPGDDLRHIDWKATAKRRKVITRQYEAERRQQVLLVLDTGRLLTAEIAGVSRLDYVVQAALELAYVAA